MSDNEHPDASGDDSPTLNRHVTIPERTASAIEDRLDGTEFESVDEYVSFALTLLLEQLDSQEDAPEPGGQAEPVENEEVRDRLETLGYL